MFSKRMAMIPLVLLAGTMSVRSAPSSSATGPADVATNFVREYDKWAQNAYPDPIPDALLASTSSEMHEVLRGDQRWYGSGGVQQHGDVKVVAVEVAETDDRHAVVSLTIDASEVTVTAGGEDTWVDYSRPIITRFHLENDDGWRITSTKTDD